MSKLWPEERGIREKSWVGVERTSLAELTPALGP